MSIEQEFLGNYEQDSSYSYTISAGQAHPSLAGDHQPQSFREALAKGYKVEPGHLASEADRYWKAFKQAGLTGHRPADAGAQFLADIKSASKVIDPLDIWLQIKQGK